jgi:hypothetical protein
MSLRLRYGHPEACSIAKGNRSIPGPASRRGDETQSERLANGATAKPNASIQSLISDFTKSAVERSKEMSEEEFERTVKESQEIIDRRVFPSRLTADS